ncbi:MAG: hypothetical protein IJ777_04180 [Clostridia bacterium]|nr:hypothetical protein [Clostridia bacterium]
MNQILTTEKKKRENKEPIEIKSIVRFFAIAIIIFGIALVGGGIYAFYQKMQEQNPNNDPTVTITRENDRAVISVSNNIEINKIIYSWNEGETTELPEGKTSATEEIVLPNENSTLNLVIEDAKGRRINYQKEFILEGVDITKPTIEVATENGSNKMMIIAKDETAIQYVSYQWEDEEQPTIIEATQEGQTEISKEISLAPGTKTIKIIAEDKNGNVEEIEKEIVATTSKPKVMLMTDGANLIVEIEDKDGIKDVEININGAVKSAKDINQLHIKVGPVKLQEGNNTIKITVTNMSGYTGSITKELQYTP